MAHAGADAGERGEDDHKAEADLCHQGVNIGLPCVGLRTVGSCACGEGLVGLASLTATAARAPDA